MDDIYNRYSYLLDFLDFIWFDIGLFLEVIYGKGVFL